MRKLKTVLSAVTEYESVCLMLSIKSRKFMTVRYFEDAFLRHVKQEWKVSPILQV